MTSGRTNQWTGNEVNLFAAEFAGYVGTKEAIPVANGSLALDLIFRGLQTQGRTGPPGYGHEVIVTSRTFIASISSIVMAGLVPVFADVDPISQNITKETIEAVRTDKTIGILCVHLAGYPCDMYPIMKLATQHNLFVIEDCAQAHGAQYMGQSVGSFGNAAAWSFCQDKIMTTGGEGGMITTNDIALADIMWSYKDHGKNADSAKFPFPSKNGFRWLHDSIGTNFRMTEIQAAIGRIQLRNLENSVKKRKSIADSYNKIAKGFSAVRTDFYNREIRHAKYKHYMFVVPKGLNDGWHRDRIISELNMLGLPANVGSCSEVYLEKALEHYVPAEHCSVARMLGEHSICFPCHPTITDEDQLMMNRALYKVLSSASKEIED